MSKIGILAYGSLIDDPGVELEPLIKDKIKDIETPFNIEFARKSSKRDGAPTVVPVKSFGAPVKATILILNDDISIENARDLLWRRETRNEELDKHYKIHKKPNDNQVVICEALNLGGVGCVLYTKIGANIKDPTPEKLAKYAIKSAKKGAGENGTDGISYLMSLKRNNIDTPLMAEYEEQILELTKSTTLEEALRSARSE